jgi:hypothetical protein
MRRYLKIFIVASLVLFQYELSAQRLWARAMSKNGKWGYIDTKGAWVMEAKFQDLLDFEGVLARAKHASKWGLIDTNGNWFVEPIYEGHKYVGRIHADLRKLKGQQFYNGLVRFKDVSRYGYKNTNNHRVIAAEYLDAKQFSSGYACVQVVSGYWGFIDTLGRWKVKPMFKDVTGFTSTGAWVTEKRKWGKLNRSGKWEVEQQFDEVKFINEEFLFVRDGKKWGILNQDGTWRIAPKFENVEEIGEGNYAVKQGDLYGVINNNGELSSFPQFLNIKPFENGFAIIKVKNGSYSYCDNQGIILEMPKTRMIMPFSPSGYAAVWLTSGWEYINKQAEFITDSQFRIVKPFNNGLGIVKQGDLWGVINEKNELVIDFQFRKLKPFAKVDF